MGSCGRVVSEMSWDANTFQVPIRLLRETKSHYPRFSHGYGFFFSAHLNTGEKIYPWTAPFFGD